MGSNNSLNIAFATMECLRQLKDAQTLAAMRGKEPNEVRPFWERKRDA
jgi:ribosomal protein S5